MKSIIVLLVLVLASMIGTAQSIYGVWEDSFNNYQFSKMDPTTAAKTSIAEIQSMSGIVSPNNTVIRADSNWYIVRVLMGTQYRLLTIDIPSGDIEYNVAFDGTFVGFEFNESNDSIYCIYHDGGSDYQLATIDHISGNYSLYPAISGVSAYLGGTFALDKANGLYTFGAYTSSGYRLLSINISDGSIAYDNALPTGLIGLEYNCQNDSLYAMQNVSNNYYLVSVNNVTGATSVIDTINGMNGYASYTASLDAWENTYSCYGFVGSASKLFHLDLSTGAELSSASISHNMAGWEGYETCNPPPSPVVEFEASDTTITAGDTISFTDLSLFNPTSWVWQFQGGLPSTSAAQNPSGIQYPSPGCYTVTLSATNAQGTNSASKVCYIEVLDSVVAEFEASDTILYVGDSIDFTDLTSNSPDSWDWFFFPGGSPSSSTVQHPQHVTYSSPGNYQVRLIASNAVNSDTITKQEYIHVYDQPVADFVANDTVIDVGDTVHFTDLSYGNIVSYAWSIQGGTPTTASIQHPSAVFNAAGCFDVTLTVTNPAGIDIETKTCYITVLDPQVESDFVGDTLTVWNGQSVNFTDLSLHNPTNWQWSFEQGTPATSTQQHPQNIAYFDIGCWEVSLHASNATGGDTVTKVCYINVVQGWGTQDFESSDLTIRPNPASSQISIENPNSDVSYQIYSIDGSCVKSGSLGNGGHSIDIMAIPPGVYVISFEATPLHYRHQLIIQR